ASEAKKKASVPVQDFSKSVAGTSLESGMHKVVIITKLSRYDKIKRALNTLGVTGITVTQVTGCGIEKGAGQMYRGVEMDMTLLPKIKLEVVVSKIPVDSVIETAKKTLYTGKIGDGKIFVYPVSRVVKIRTGEEDFAALQDVE
ncbi:MAG: P-II family nitrogen regulator, partial [Lachnospiraceae bacterium]|nr:P-II family nitrogen regulator [Lachnospiraceae bacterium]